MVGLANKHLNHLDGLLVKEHGRGTFPEKDKPNKFTPTGPVFTKKRTREIRRNEEIGKTDDQDSYSKAFTYTDIKSYDSPNHQETTVTPRGGRT